MRRRLRIMSLILALGLVAAPHWFGTRAQRDRDDNWNDRDFTERDEFNQTYQLQPGARVRVSGINGTVDVDTQAGNTAEVHVVRSARNRDDLNYRKVIVEQSGNSLVIRGEKDNDRWSGRREVRQRVTLVLPRYIDLDVSGVNGRTRVGEVDGPVKLSGINGAVEVGQATGYSEISGINGRVKMTIARLGERGINVSGVNGGVELRFIEELNANVDVTGINGSVDADMPNVTIHGKIDRQNFHAKIGSGGTPITVSGVNGHVRLLRAGSAM